MDDILVQCPSDVPLACINECEAWGECIVRCDVLGRCNRDTAVECWFQATDFQRCLDANAPDLPLPTDPGVFVPPTPGACPAGQHSHNGNCHADHVCGADEIGGGSAECQACGAGQVPNPDGTACQSCPHGEGSPGQCNSDPCGRDATDSAALAFVGGIGKEPQEQGVTFYCKGGKSIEEYGWASSTAANACGVSVSVPNLPSCWTGHHRADDCRLSFTHTHPWFTWPADKGVRCGLRGNVLDTEEEMDDQNRRGLDFSGVDVSAADQFGVESHLGVSDRSCTRARRLSDQREVIAGACTSPTAI